MYPKRCLKGEEDGPGRRGRQRKLRAAPEKKVGKHLERRGTSHKSAVTTGWLRAAMELRGL